MKTTMNVLLISSDIIDTQMAGPGIRYWEFARQLSRQHRVTLVTPNQSRLLHPRFQILQRTRQTLTRCLKASDVVITQGYLFPLAPLMMTNTPVVIDLYDPLPIEVLEHHAHLSLREAQLSQSYCVARTKLLLQRGDFFLYSHDRQRDYWLGMLTAVGRVNHQEYRREARLSHLFGHVPYGISDHPPVQTQSVLRGPKGPFTDSDTIVLWGGGLWNWFDPCSVIRAMHRISAERHDIKLLFLGGKRAEGETNGLNIAYGTQEAITLSQQLGLYNRSVFFHDTWVPYQERQQYFLEADLGISTHCDSLETRFAFRTRLLDYFWADLPIITTRGDYLSDLVEQQQLGIVVDPASVEQIYEALVRLTDVHSFREQCRENIRHIRTRYLWSRVLEPLEAFCERPYRTCQLSGVTRSWQLGKFYGNTAKLLLQYRGYKKILTRFRRFLGR